MNKDNNKFVHFFFGLLLITGMMCKSFCSYADASFAHRPEVQSFIRDMVREHHFSKPELNQLFTQVNYQPKIIESMTKPYEKKPWETYRAIFIKPERVQEGLAFWKQNRATLQMAEKKYGVPANIIVAILGVETRYGLRQGEYRVLDALSTLAFNYPARSPFFKKELKEFLLLCREHHVSPTQYLGSYAGAIGMPQFMPSSYRYYADDFAGLNKKDLIHDEKAVIASVGNYFRQHGWKLNQAVVQPAQLTGQAYQQVNFTLKTPEYPVNKLKRIGVEPLPPTPNAIPYKAGVIELTTLKGHEYWLAYNNFYVITRYNSSPQYALVVYLLSEQLKQEWAKLNAPHSHAYG